MCVSYVYILGLFENRFVIQFRTMYTVLIVDCMPYCIGGYSCQCSEDKQ